jgi:prepilin-type N-terminal cleavage/methylation domain-containing protein
MRINRNKMMRSRQRGYSLVEVLIALAITSIVLLTVLTLFYMGRRNVYSGKQMTLASSVGTRMLEDLSTNSADDLRTNFVVTDNPVPADVTLPGLAPVVAGQTSYIIPNSLKRDSTGCTWVTTANSNKPAMTVPGYDCTNDANGVLGRWYAMVAPNNAPSSVLTNPEVGLVITPRSPADGAKPVTTARFYKVRAYVAWNEGPTRRRYAFFDTTRVNR